VWSKVAGEIAIGIRKRCGRRSLWNRVQLGLSKLAGGAYPSASIDACPRRRDIAWYRVTCPLPEENIDVTRTPFYRIPGALLLWRSQWLDIEYIPAAPVIVEFRTKTLAVIDRDPASYITSTVRVAVVTRGGAKIDCISTTKYSRLDKWLLPRHWARDGHLAIWKPSSIFVAFTDSDAILLGPVWRLHAFGVSSLTPSTISTSPCDHEASTENES